MSNCVYAIFSHTNPAQVIRLVQTLHALSPRAAIVVHHDPAHTCLDRASVERAGGLVIPDPITAEWGDFTQVRQHLHTMRWCVANLNFEWYVILTGQSYPIKPLVDFESYLGALPYDACVTHFDAYDPTAWPHGEAMRRYHYRYAKLPRFRYWHRIPAAIYERVPMLIRTFNRAQGLLRMFTFPRGLPTRLGLKTLRRPFGKGGPRLVAGNMNANYRKATVEYVLDYVDSNPQYGSYFERTALPDEVFFTTIIANAPALKVSNNNLRHINWPSGQAASGAVMSMDDLDTLVSSPAFFGLKFDETQCPELLEYIDRRLGAPHSGATP